jgi:hypothetical protein
MSILKHMVMVARLRLNSIWCKHQDTRLSSCPYTGKTYTMCNKCLSTVKSERTDYEKE